MQIDKLRTVIILLIVISFIVITSSYALYPLYSKIPATEYMPVLDKFSSIYSGIVGIIVGFLFGSGRKNGE